MTEKGAKNLIEITKFKIKKLERELRNLKKSLSGMELKKQNEEAGLV